MKLSCEAEDNQKFAKFLHALDVYSYTDTQVAKIAKPTNARLPRHRPLFPSGVDVVWGASCDKTRGALLTLGGNPRLH